MPFDVIPVYYPAGLRPPRTAEQSAEIARLAWALRNLGDVKPGFRWSYGDYDRCAVGLWLAMQGRDESVSLESFHVLQDRMGLTPDDFGALFVAGVNGSYRGVTPEIVAQRLEAIL